LIDDLTSAGVGEIWIFALQYSRTVRQTQNSLTIGLLMPEPA